MNDGVLKIAALVKPVDQGLVERIENALSMAKSGELTHFFGFGHCADGGTYTSTGPTEDIWRDIAVLETLKYRMIYSMDAE